MLGTLLVRPQNAKLLHDTEFFGKMSPYLRITAGTQIVNSAICKKGHLTPTWDSELRVFLNGSVTFLIFELFNKEHFSKDDLIGSAQFSLNELTMQGFRGWVPLVYNGGDAGAIFMEMTLIPEQQQQSQINLVRQAPVTPTLQESLNSSLLKPTPIFQQNQIPQQMSIERETLSTRPSLTNLEGEGSRVFLNRSQILEPIIHKQDSIIKKEEPVYYYERPIVHEKTIIIEKPVITEKVLIYCEQPIIIEKPEIHERIIYQREQPVIMREEAVIIREQPCAQIENLERYGTPLVQKETEHRRDNPVIMKDIPKLFQQQLITEKPIIIEKDIINIEKPIYVEKPEIHERPLIRESVIVRETSNPVLISEVSQEPMPTDIQPEIHSEMKRSTLPPVYQKERPEIYERSIITEKPIIREQPIIYAEQQVVQERHEIRERKIFHQEQVKIIQEEAVLMHDEPKP